MTTVNRRDALRLAGIGLVAVAGCLGDTPNAASENDGPDGTSTDDADPADGSNGTKTDEHDDAGTPKATGESELRDYETHSYAADASVPDWYHDEEPAGAVTVIDSRDRFDAALDSFELPDDRRESVTAFLEDVDFEGEVVLHVATAGPNTCFGEVAIDDIAIEDGVLAGAATAVGPDDEEAVCGDALTFPSTLVKATVDGPTPSTAELTITDGWGNEEAIDASADDPLSPAPDDLDGAVRPDGDPPAVPRPLECEDDVERVGAGYAEGALEWGEATDEDGTPTLALRVADGEVARGDRIHIEMTNVSDERQFTGNDSKYNLEVKTERGWQDVRVATETPIAYTDEAIGHRPGEGFSWSFDLTEAGVVDDGVYENRLEACPVPAGRYRFVCWEPTVAVAFDLVE